MSRKGQFLLIAIVLLALAFFIIFSYFRSTGAASTLLFEESSVPELENIINSVQARNSFLQGWWNLSWNAKMKINISTRTKPANITVEFPQAINCSQARLTNKTGSLITLYVNDSQHITQTHPICNFTFDDSTSEVLYYLYFNPEIPVAANNIRLGINFIDVQEFLAEEPFFKLCKHLNETYPMLGIALECSAIKETNFLNYSINFSAPDLKFKAFLN